MNQTLIGLIVAIVIIVIVALAQNKNDKIENYDTSNPYLNVTDFRGNNPNVVGDGRIVVFPYTRYLWNNPTRLQPLYYIDSSSDYLLYPYLYNR